MCPPNCPPKCPPNAKKGAFWALLGRYLFRVFYAPQKVALAVAIRHKKTPFLGVFIRVLVIIRVYIPANGNYFYLNGNYRAITR